MHSVFFSAIFISSILCAEWEGLFLGGNNPAIIEDVHVVTGHLNLQFEEERILGPVAIPITRTYCSSGAEIAQDIAVQLSKLCRTISFESGWSLESQLQMLVDPRAGDDNYETSIKVYLSEPNGSVIPFCFSHTEGKEVIVLKPKISGGQGFGILSALTNPKNHRIELNFKKGRAVVYLASGGYRVYTGEYFAVQDNLKKFAVPLAKRKLRYYRLEEERLPSGHYLIYKHQKESQLLSISLLDPSKVKCYAQVDFVIAPEAVTLFSKRGRATTYTSFLSRERLYLEEVDLLGHPKQVFTYRETKKGMGDLLESMRVGDIEELRVRYDAAYKVETIERPNGVVAHFSYESEYTDVRDITNTLTRYHHSEGKLQSIEYFDEKEELVSSQKFFWSNDYLIGKAMCNAEGKGIFSKTFTYDEFGNVVEEVLYGNLTGGAPTPFTIDETARLQNAEKYTKTYRYDKYTHLLLEEEDKGLIYRYNYKEGTNLLTSKEIYFEDRLLRKESWRYDEEHLLVETEVDDGYISKVVQFENDENTGLCKARYEKGWKRSVYDRGPDGQIKEEVIYDANGGYCYTLYTDYDLAGRVTRKTTPSGLENCYVYDSYGHLVESKEVGSPKKTFVYDDMHRCTHASQKGKSSEIVYDVKGNICIERDGKGLVYEHFYDCFGKRLKTSIPSFGQEISYAYDIQGNLIKKRSPKGHVTKTAYTTFQKPSYIQTPDGAITRHRYNLSGLLDSTLHPDQTLIVYQYDLLDRMIAKKIYDATYRLLSEEKWRYIGDLLDTYVEKTGLETRYIYDSFGRLIEENRGGRVKSYTYDRLGFLETTTIGDILHTEIHDEEGRVIEELTGIEDHKFYTFNEENKKTEVTTVTSVGDATDYFTYDPVGRVASHKGPNGAITTFQYDDLTKTIIDPLGNLTIESYDLLSRKIETKKIDVQGKISFLEQFVYDLEGNKTSQRSFIYANGVLKRTLEVSFIYDAIGRVVHQVEEGDKRTSYRYDSKGRNIAHTKPDGITLHRTYDGLDRITSLKTRDGSIFYEYVYDVYDNPVEIRDRVQGHALRFSYNPFSEVTQEGDLSWEYDERGRVTTFMLPDHSSIAYTYTAAHMQSIKRLDQCGSLLYEHTYTQFDLNGHVQEEEMIASLGRVKTTRDLLERPIYVTSPYGVEQIAYNLVGLITSKEHTLLEKKTYAYDSLYQLIKEGDESYHFDSLGHRSEDEVNEYNQVMRRGSDTFSYDLNGNLIRDYREYHYDGLDRLISIVTPQKQKVLYTYDPLSRLSSKERFSYYKDGWKSVEKRRYLYNKEVEIGSIDEGGNILDLKVLGLGIKGEVGGAVALEIEGILYAPLHDTSGNIVALINVATREIEETYAIDSFGQEIKDLYQSPWRFSSKREEEGLIFFGCRFYHPELGRWLTPDPLGFKESRNPYLFVLNSPVNRLDLLGLLSIPNFYFEDSRDRYYGVLVQTTTPIAPGLLNVASFGRVQTNVICIHDSAHVLQFSQQEIASGQFNLLDHLHEIIPSQGEKVGMALYGNGINTNQECWKNTCLTIASLLPEGPVLLSLHNPTDGLFKDLMRVFRTFNGYENDRAQMLRELHLSLLTDIHERNDKASILNIAYSEGALNYFTEFRGLEPTQQELVRNHFLVNTIGAPRFSPKSFGKDCINYFSEKDYIAKIPGKKYMGNPDYVIKEVQCLSHRNEMLAGYIDHAILAPTYIEVMSNVVKETEKNYGFYRKNDR